MKPVIKYTFKYLLLLSILTLVLGSNASINEGNIFSAEMFFPPDSTNNNDTTINLIYPFNDDNGNPFYPSDTNPLFLRDPSNVRSIIEYDPATNKYIFKKKIGDFDFRDPTSMRFEEYLKYDLKQSVKDYWRERSLLSGKDSKSRIIPEIHIGGKAFDKIFGGNTIDIRPQGSAELIFGIRGNSNENPTLNVRQRSQVNFDFQEKIQMNVIAKIGDKIEFKTNYNTESTFDFENKLKLNYEGDEDVKSMDEWEFESFIENIDCYDIYWEKKDRNKEVAVFHSYKTYIIDREGQMRYEFIGVWFPSDIIPDLEYLINE